jgi:subtilisin family serine protease
VRVGEHRERVLGQARLTKLVAESSGGPEVRIALIDGPIGWSHPGLRGARMESVPGFVPPQPASEHATFLASMLVGRGGDLLGLCPGCTLLSVPVIDAAFERAELPARDAAARVVRAVGRALSLGAEVIQLRLDLSPEAAGPFDVVACALESAAARGVRTVLAAGCAGESPVLDAVGVVPVAAALPDGSMDPETALGTALGSRGMLAPGTDLPGAVLPAGTALRSGSSYAAAFVTGTFALLRSRFPRLGADRVWEEMLDERPRSGRRAASLPPVLDAEAIRLRAARLAMSISANHSSKVA